MPYSDSMGTRGPEAPDLSAGRVHDYMPDNVFARLSCGAKDVRVTVEEREKAMKALADKLGNVVAIGGKKEAA